MLYNLLHCCYIFSEETYYKLVYEENYIRLFFFVNLEKDWWDDIWWLFFFNVKKEIQYNKLRVSRKHTNKYNTRSSDLLYLT